MSVTTFLACYLGIGMLGVVIVGALGALEEDDVPPPLGGFFAFLALTVWPLAVLIFCGWVLLKIGAGVRSLIKRAR